MNDEPEPMRTDIRAEWGSASELEQVFVDELFFTLTQQQGYLTFGQVQVSIAPGGSQTATVQPMARLVMTRDALARFVRVLNRAVQEEK